MSGYCGSATTSSLKSPSVQPPERDSALAYLESSVLRSCIFYLGLQQYNRSVSVYSMSRGRYEICNISILHKKTFEKFSDLITGGRSVKGIQDTAERRAREKRLRH